jgi:hypothetical protein
MKQLLDPRNFIPANFFGSGKPESEKSDNIEIIESGEEQAGTEEEGWRIRDGGRGEDKEA